MATTTQNTEFIDISSTFFKDFHKPRLQLLFLLVPSLSTIGSINLVKLAAGLKSPEAFSSNYQRIQRFIHHIRFDSSSLAPFILRLAKLSGPYTLMMDRTNWQFGKAKINFLMLSVKGNGWAVPLLWTLLPKKGNSNEQERIDLTNQFIQIFGLAQIHNLVADREFIGDIWLPLKTSSTSL